VTLTLCYSTENLRVSSTLFDNLFEIGVASGIDLLIGAGVNVMLGASKSRVILNEPTGEVKDLSDLTMELSEELCHRD